MIHLTKKNTIQNINIGRIEEVSVRYVLVTLSNYGINWWKKTKNFLISNISINENVSNFIFASRLFLEPELKRKSSKIKIKINPSKKDISKVKYDFLDSSGNNLIFSTEVDKKKFGDQFGGIISIEKKEKEKKIKFFKTHQDGSRFTNYSDVIYNSKSISLAGPVNIRELKYIVY